MYILFILLSFCFANLVTADLVTDGSVVAALTFKNNLPRERLELTGNRVKYFRDTDTMDELWIMRTDPDEAEEPFRDPQLGFSLNKKDAVCPGSVVLNGGACATAQQPFSRGTFLGFQCRYWGSTPVYGGNGDHGCEIWLQNKVSQYKNGKPSDGVVAYLQMTFDYSSPYTTGNLARFWLNGTNNLYFTPEHDNTGQLGVIYSTIDKTGEAAQGRRWQSLHIGTGESTFAGNVVPQEPAGASLGDPVNKWHSLHACYVYPDCLSLGVSDPAPEKGKYQLHIRPYGDGTVYLAVKTPTGEVFHFKGASGAPTNKNDRF